MDKLEQFSQALTKVEEYKAGIRKVLLRCNNSHTLTMVIYPNTPVLEVCLACNSKLVEVNA